jgi:nicotinamide mononucleotide adenylyltransferase
MTQSDQTKDSIIEMGVIHGRFQVVHNDHVKYLMAGKALCNHLVVGVTNPDPLATRQEDADLHRHSSRHNPLTYFERLILVRSVLDKAGVPEADFSVVPFPIHFPEQYKYYVPMTAIFFLTIYDDWGRKKLNYFKAMGLKTHVMWEGPPENKGTSATDVRRRMICDEPWEHLVPPEIAGHLKEWDISKRLKALNEAWVAEGSKPE